MGIKSKIHNYIGHLYGKLTKDYYFEDYIRVYPDGIVYNKYGRRRQPSKNTVNNFLNHCKFYKFAAQFAKDKDIADIGCGSGYGCEILKKSGAAKIVGTDISKKSIKYAKSRYSDFAEFSIQGITNLNEYSDDSFDITISSEVLEHIKEYGMEEKAVSELKRITRNGGLLIIGTPNSEMAREHGFYFEEINNLFNRNFSTYCIFENALVPFGNAKSLWEKRLSEGRVGVIISELINLSETVLPKDANAEIKKGIKAGRFKFADYDVDTTLLHNTHSWVIIAVNNK